MSQNIRGYIVSQFKHPTGKIGKIAGWIMASRKSNITRNQFTVNALAIKPDDNILEIGCGPGIALSEILRRLDNGRLVGLDHSSVMINHASKRCAGAVTNGTLELWNDNFETREIPDHSFDKVFCVNVVQFFNEQDAAINKIHRILKQGGIAAITYMPRTKKPTREAALDMAKSVSKNMKDVGFSEVGITEYDLSSSPAVTIVGTR